MQCLAGCLNCFKRNEHKLDHAKGIRNNFLSGVEKANLAMNIILCFFGFLMIITGIAFIANDLWDDAGFSLRAVK